MATISSIMLKPRSPIVRPALVSHLALQFLLQLQPAGGPLVQLRKTVNWARERPRVIAPSPSDRTVMKRTSGVFVCCHRPAGADAADPRDVVDAEEARGVVLQVAAGGRRVMYSTAFRRSSSRDARAAEAVAALPTEFELAPTSIRFATAVIPTARTTIATRASTSVNPDSEVRGGVLAARACRSSLLGRDPSAGGDGDPPAEAGALLHDAQRTPPAAVAWMTLLVSAQDVDVRAARAGKAPRAQAAEAELRRP